MASPVAPCFRAYQMRLMIGGRFNSGNVSKSAFGVHECPSVVRHPAVVTLRSCSALMPSNSIAAWSAARNPNASGLPPVSG
jgi:hypothetical protein